MKKILIVFSLMVLLGGCAAANDPAATKPTGTVTLQEGENVFTEPGYAEAQLMCAAESEEEAEELAQLYGITLVGYKNGLARFHTEEDPREVIRIGKENGWPELVLNRVTPLS